MMSCKNRFLALLLCLAMLVGLAPGAALAADEEALQFGMESSSVDLGGTDDFSYYLENIPEGASVSWTSSNPGVATVSSSGQVRGVSPGTAVITATAGGQSATMEAEVMGNYDVRIYQNHEVMDVGDSFSLDVDVTPSGEKVTWSSSAPSVVSVTQYGVVNAISSGTATITASVAGGAETDTCIITVSKPVVVACDPTSLDLVVGDTATIRSGANQDVALTWRSYNESVATVDQNGRVTAVGKGTTTILVAANNSAYGSSTCQVNVQEPSVQPKITIKQTSPNVYIGNTVTLEADVVPAGSAIQWNSTNTNIVTVQSSTGTTAVIKGVSAGTAHVYAYLANDKSVFSQSYVTVINQSAPGQTKTGTIAFDKYALYPKVGETMKITATVAPSTMPIQGWSSNNTAVATVDANGYVKGVSKGTAVISAYNTEYGALTKCTVYVDSTAAATPALSTSTLSVNAGETSSAITMKNVPTGGWVKWYVTSGSAANVSLITSGTSNEKLQVKGNSAGTVTVTAMVTDSSNNNTANANLKITVTEPTGTVSYKVDAGSSVQFSASDFNRLCSNLVGGTLEYIMITKLPGSAYGTLYTGSGAAGTFTNYWYSARSPYVSNLYFTAASDKSGSVSIPFTGWSTSGKSFSGTVNITINRASGDLSYSVTQNSSVVLSSIDFSNLCLRLTGQNLSNVRFTSLPASNRGTLYTNYGTSSSRAVSANTSYNTGTVSAISFVPSGSYTGSVSVPFIGTATNNTTFSGNLYFTVKQASTMQTTYTVEQGQRATLDSAYFNTYCKSLTSDSLNYIQFTSVPSNLGTLYNTLSGTSNTLAASNTPYYRIGTYNTIDGLVFEAGTSATGTVNFPFTGRSSNGKTFTGTLAFKVTASSAKSSTVSFADVPANASYYQDLQYVVNNNIFSGIGNNSFGPDQTMTRGQMVQVLWRIAGSSEPKTTSSFTDVSSSAYYAKAVAWAVENGYASGTGNGTFSPDSSITREQFLTILHNYAKSAGRYSSVSGWANISGYGDSGSVDSWAEASMQWAIGNGIAYDISGNLQPTTAAPRYQVAEFLSRFCQKYR